jgi:hypothetical protein
VTSKDRIFRIFYMYFDHRLLVGFEVHVEDAVYETEIEACCEDDELKEEHAKWSGESHCCHLFPAFVLEIKRCENIGILRDFAKSGCMFG